MSWESEKSPFARAGEGAVSASLDKNMLVRHSCQVPSDRPLGLPDMSVNHGAISIATTQAILLVDWLVENLVEIHDRLDTRQQDVVASVTEGLMI